MNEARKTIVVTAIGVVSPYGVGLGPMADAMLAGQCRLGPLQGVSPGFAATAAEIGALPPLEAVGDLRPSRTDQLAVMRWRAPALRMGPCAKRP